MSGTTVPDVSTNQTAFDPKAKASWATLWENDPLVILGGVRTPFVKAYGPIAGMSASQLGVHAVNSLVDQLKLDKSRVDEVIFGNVSSPADSANIARVISLLSGIPQDRIAHPVKRNCSSGMEALITASQAMRDRGSKLILAGGTESMSNVPLLWNRASTKWFLEMSKQKGTWAKFMHYLKFRPSFLDPVVAIKLGLTDPSCGLNMGETAELVAQDFHINRIAQDEFALESHERALAAQASGFLTGEIAPIPADLNRGKAVIEDVGPRKGQSLESLAKLKPYFRREDGTVTVGNSCPITDGAVAMAVTTMSEVGSFGVEPLGYIKGYAIAGCDPSRMGLGPVYAIEKLLRQTGMKLNDFELFEINEAFAAQVLGCLTAMNSEEFCQKAFGRSEPIGVIPREKLNVHGGAIALGHPVGATGARLVLTLLRALKEQGKKRGLASLCIGGGQGYAIWLETA